MSTRREKKKGWLAEFREFAMRGNVIDLAVGIIIGGAFGKIVSSLVEDVFMPIIGMLIGGVNFDTLYIILPPTPLGDDHAPIKLMLGRFISTIIDFILIALCVFLFVKLINTLRRKTNDEQEAPAEPSADIVLLTEIRDLLKKQDIQSVHEADTTTNH